MSDSAKTMLGWLALALGVFVYLHNLGSEHATTNHEEYLHWQATRVTAEGGQWLPLKEAEHKVGPALIWQGVVLTDWGRHWELWRLRLPAALYTLATAILGLLLARRLSGSTGTGLLAATLFLAFFGTYRHGRLVLNAAPETFWFFLPFFILLYPSLRRDGLSWSQTLAFGFIVGAGLLYGSLALIVSFCACLAWWTIQRRSGSWLEWIRRDAPKIALLGILAFAVFMFWPVSYTQQVSPDSSLGENGGAFDAARGNAFANLFADRHSIWGMLAGYLLSVGLLAPAIVALFVVAFRDRRTLADTDKLLWIWIITQMIVFSLPGQYGKSYLLPAMPALAVLAALHWSRLPRWTMSITLLVAGTIVSVLLLGGLVLTGELAEGPVYPWYFAPAMATIAGAAFVALFRADWTRTMAAPAVLLVYMAYALFCIPFDGPRGRFPRQTIDAVQGRTVVLPASHHAQGEIYRFTLPGAVMESVPLDPAATIEQLRTEHSLFILTVPCSNTALAQYPGVRILGDHLRLLDPLTEKQLWKWPCGDITEHIFRKDLLIEIDK